MSIILSVGYGNTLDSFHAAIGQNAVVQSKNQRIQQFYPDRLNSLGLSADKSPVENAVKVLTNFANAYSIEPGNVRLEAHDQKGHLHYVIFRQTVNSVPVYQSKIDFRFRDNHLLLMSRIQTYPNLDVDTNPTIDRDMSQEIIQLETQFNPDRNDMFVKSPELFVYLDYSDEVQVGRLAWLAKVQIHHPRNSVYLRAVSFYEVWIDAHSGDLISMIDRAEDIEITGRITGMVKDVPYGTPTERPLEDLRVQVSGIGDTYTDEDGFYTIDIGTTQRDVTVDFYGYYLDIDTRNTSEAVITVTATPGDTINMLFDDLVSLPSERDTYFHANLVHDWITDLDNDFTGADYVMPAAVNIGSEDPYWPCNAYWNGTGINMFSAGGGCSDTGEMADVIYHEYQHGLTQFAYDPFPSPYESGMGEGFSDYTAMTIRNSPCLGDAFFGTPGDCLRDGENTRQFPGNECGGSVHCLGEISMGSMWQMRKNLINTFGDSAAAVAHSDTLFRWAMFGRPYTVPELLDEILIADDDDGTLVNGTPNFTDIADGFAQHNVYASIPEYGIAHTPIMNMDAAPNPILIEAFISSIHGDIVNPQLHYSILGTNTTIPMNPTEDPSTFQAFIPAMESGTIVTYYIDASDAEGNYMIVPETAPEHPYFFLVGDIQSFPVLASDNAETDQGWTLGIDTDQASTGIWERVDPIGTEGNGIQAQPEFDHTPNGEICFVTGNAEFDGTNVGENDVDGGVTTLVSLPYNLSGVLQPILTYWRWYTNNAGDSPGEDVWRVQISSDSQNWITLEETSESQSSWVYKQYLIDEYVDLNETVYIRFQADDSGDGSIVEAGVDDIEIRNGLSLNVDPGDMDFSQTLDIYDILAMADAITGEGGPNGIQTYVGDINGDGILNIMDVIIMVQMVLDY